MRYTVTVESKPDAKGRQTFCVEWPEAPREDCLPKYRGTGKRAQYFFAVLEEHVARWRAAGVEVVIQ